MMLTPRSLFMGLFALLILNGPTLWAEESMTISKKEAAKELGEPLAKLMKEKGEPLEVDPDLLNIVETVWTDPGEIPRFQVVAEDERYLLPLKHTHVDAKITGTVVRVETTQTYENPFDHPIETVYVFPLPENSAVDDMKMVIGERVIEAEIQKKEEARQTYETAKKEGHTAALLEQERPNIFTQSVANIAAKEQIEVKLRYVQDLSYDGGTYEFVFPMVVGPRYIPGDAVSAKQKGTGGSQETTEVGDASRITPPIVGAGERTGHDISIEVTASNELEISDVVVPTHEIALEKRGDGSIALALAEKDSIPNRDFVMRYKVVGKEPKATISTYRKGENGYFTFIVHPPELDIDQLVGPREFIFVVDISGSMSGKPLAMCKDAMQTALDGMRPVDTFNVITFASSEQLLWNEARPANLTNLLDAKSFIDGLTAGGGTEMKNAIDAALDSSGEGRRSRFVFFMTDGFVGNEEAILEKTKNYVEAFDKLERTARVFGFGVGSSPNRYLLDGLAESGRGSTVYASNREDPTRAVNRFFELVDHVVIENVELKWEGVDVSDVFPVELPPLFASKPLVVHGRFSQSGSGKAILKGRADGKGLELPVVVDFLAEDHGDDVQATLWARAKLHDLERDLWGGYDTRVVEAITDLGLTYRIVTAYTSFVAVDRSRVVGNGDPTTIVQPVDAAEDVDISGLEGSKVGTKVVVSKQQIQISEPSSVRYEDAPREKSKEKKSSKTPAKKSRPPKDSAPSPRSADFSVGEGSGVGGVRGETAQPAAQDSPVTAPDAEVQGALDTTEIKSIIRKSIKKIQQCYESELLNNPMLSGKISLEITINSKGVVTGVKVVSNTLEGDGGEAVAACMMKEVKKLKFPKSNGEVKINYPFVFKSEK